MVDTLLYKFVAFRLELTSVSLRLFSQSLSRSSGTSPMKKGLSSVELVVDLCCSLYKVLTLDPVPVIGNMIYVGGAESLSLSDLMEEILKPCPAHKFNFRHTVGTLLQHASMNKRCSCESSPGYSANQKNEVTEETRVCPFVDKEPKKACAQRLKGGGGEVAGNSDSSGSTRTILWAYEVDNVVAAYKWLIHSQSCSYPKCCEAVIVYQLKRSQSFLSGLYIYKTQPTHFSCTAKRPLMVLDQFNFASQLQ